MDRRELERAVGAVIVPALRAGDGMQADVRPDPGYLRRHPPAGLLVRARAGEGPRDARDLLDGARADLEAAGEASCFAACELEHGTGLPFTGATQMPPALALAAAAAGARGGELRGLERLRASGALTGREARARGVQLLLAPTVELVPGGGRAWHGSAGFGDEPVRVASRARAFVEGLRAAGVAAGAPLRFLDSEHAATGGAAAPASAARVGRDDARLGPLRTLVVAGVEAIVVEHLDGALHAGEAGVPPIFPAATIEAASREGLGPEVVVLADARGAPGPEEPRWSHARALQAGCDGLLGPPDPPAAARELLGALESGALSVQRLATAASRMRTLRARLMEPGRSPLDPDPRPAGSLALELADSALCLSGPRWAWKPGRRCEVLAPLRQARSQEARAGLERLRRALAGSARPAGVVLPVVVEGPAGSGRHAPTSEELGEIEAKVASLRSLGWKVGLVWLASPETLPQAWWSRADPPVLVAFAPTPPMLGAVERWLRGRSRAGGSLPCALG